MMDHARHMSSPSPTSPFLFHHSERSYKSNPLTPLLSSTVVADVTNVDDCFSTTSTSLNHQGHIPFGVEHHSLVDTHHSHHHQQNHQSHLDHCTIDQDSLTGVDDDDGMHNMLSGSSTSSNSNMPLLNESHSHHSFTRISLEEYSPLSLVEDCDNALPISPTSLGCGPHSFKSSMNGLKMDNLVGDVGDNDHDDVNDARSLSPSILSHSTNNHNNLWSTSSTAISQNSSLLTNTSSSFLLSHHHHHHQLNTLMQQLEPQSLDEPPPLISKNSVETNLPAANRPSSEPPPGCGIELTDVESKSLNNQTMNAKSKQSDVKTSTISASAVPSVSAPSRSRKSRSRSGASKQTSNAGNKNSEQNRKIQAAKNASGTSSTSQEPIQSSKLFLQLNHHKKLQELQQRLFGTNPQNNGTGSSTNDDNSKATNNSASASSAASLSANSAKDEPDSSAGNKDTSTDLGRTAISKRNRQTRNRRNRAAKNETSGQTPVIDVNPKSSQKTVTTETAEPDTTTKSSDSTKLADLLSNNRDTKSNTSFVYNGSSFVSTPETSSSETGEKRMQQIQLQVSPSLTVVANSGLMQPIGLQQQQTNGPIITTSGATFTNQFLCRPQTVVATSGGQLKGIVSNNELIKSGETILSNWSLQTNGGINQTGGISNANGQSGQAIGAHQIAIQVICQDGTSLVLPVSSAAGLNAAVSLSSQHQQLQAVLANNANQQRGANQLLPLMSVSNIVAQQQASNNESQSSALIASIQNSTSTQTSGLAASSPTLAALLDAGTNRNNNDLNGTSLSNQNFVSTNLLRKLVSGNTGDLKRGELTLQQGSTLSLSNCGPLVTVCSANNTANTSQSTNKNLNGSGLSEKRIKLESSETCNNVQTTFTLIDPQSLIVATGNEKTNKQNAQNPTNSNSTATQQQQAIAKVNQEVAKQSKMNSTTGNRQVDPTQPFRCEHCSSTFTRLGNFTRHKKIHTVPTKDGQRFKCDVCSKSFLQRCDLARHLHIHRGTEPHRCNICGKGYIRHSDLVTHQRFHNKEKPFGCPHCSKGFCQRGDLNRHLRSIHLQMKPILCPCCNRKFAKQETLLRHLNTAHRSKPGTTTTGAVIAELPQNYNISRCDDKQAAISVVKATNAPVASLQAIQATLCKVPQSADPSMTSGLKTGLNSEQESTIKSAS